ncbi:MAG: WG repeat-containing protein [Bacteroidaceae bacterium]|nr:WG repeat-containing protein [Bacteroidaceae bacterium]
MNKRFSTLCMALVALCAALLTACSGTTSGENNTVGIIDYLAFENNSGDGAFLMNLEGDIIELPENLMLPSSSVNGIFTAFDKGTNLYYFFKTEKDPKPIGEGYKKVGAFTGKYAPVVDSNDQLRYIDRSGKEAFSVLARDAGNFFCGRALFCADDGKGGMLWGYLDEKGEVVIPTDYYAANRFNEGYAVVWKDAHTWAVIDKEGNELLSDIVNHSAPKRDGAVREDLVQNGYLLAMNPSHEILFVYDIAHPDKSFEKAFDSRMRLYDRVCEGRVLVNQKQVYKIIEGDLEYVGEGRLRSQFDNLDYPLVMPYPLEVKGADKIALCSNPSAMFLVDTGGTARDVTSQLERSHESYNQAFNAMPCGTKEPSVGSTVYYDSPIFGRWSNGDDMNSVTMVLVSSYGVIDGHKGYGNLSTSVEYELCDNFLIKNITLSEHKAVLYYDKVAMEFTGDLDNPDSEGEWVEKLLGSDSLVVIPVNNRTLKIESSDASLNGTTLFR